MATATDSPTTPKPTPQDDRVVYHPLDQLRGIIRRYVVIEGILSVLLFLVAWFTVVLAVDFGLFKAFTWDWVQDSAMWLRGLGLAVALLLLVAIVAFRIVRRLMTEFSYPALALVLERRFPKLLGDRLITAVELADEEKAAKVGYSVAMVRQTINEARERVGKVPVNEVFNWRRLRLMTLLLVGWVVGLIVFGLGGYALAAGEFNARNAAWKSYHTAAILVERDVLLRDTPWPRRALLVLQGDAAKETGIRIARDGAAPQVRVKAYRWVYEDRSQFDGWRPLKWSDVKQSLVGIGVPDLSAVHGTAVDTSNLTADDILENAATREKLQESLGSDKYTELQAVFDRLEAMAADPAYERTLRKLDRPAEVTFRFTGIRTSGEGALKAEGTSDFVGEIGGLQEDVLFRIRAEDYRTPQRPITRVPPPVLNTLTKVEYQPAYLHYASPADPAAPGKSLGWNELAPYHQKMPEERLTLTGNRTTTVVPVGTQLVITGTTERPIVKAWAKPKVGRLPGAKVDKRKDGTEVLTAEPIPLTLIDENTFTFEFMGDRDKITAATTEFDFILENEDGLQSKREMVIQATEDSAPVVEVVPDIIRKVGKDYWVTPKAKIPFNTESSIRDDYGLSRVVYRATFKVADAGVVQSLRAGLLARSLPTLVVSRDANAARAVFAVWRDYAQQVLSDEANAEKTSMFGLGKFYELDKDVQRETLATLLKLFPEAKTTPKVEFVKRFSLETKLLPVVTRQGNGQIDTYKWEVVDDFFDIGKLQVAQGKPLEVSPGDIQPRYDLALTIEATDTNVDTGPKVGKSEPISILVVSSSDLLFEINKDQEKLGQKLDDAVKRLTAARSRYEFVVQKVDRSLREDLAAVKVRSKDVIQDVAKARELVDDVRRQFDRITKETIVNQLEDKTIALYGGWTNRFERVMGGSPSPVSRTEDEALHYNASAARPYGALTPKGEFPKTEKRLIEGQTAFEEERFPEPGVVTEAYIFVKNLEEEVTDLRDMIHEADREGKLKRDILKIKEDQERIDRQLVLAKLDKEKDDLLPIPKLGDLGQVFLGKGEVKKIKQAVKWRQFVGLAKPDTLFIKVMSSDPAAVIVPAELKLDYDREQFEFEYEIRAGTKEGEFKVTLTPEVGDPVVVSVQVK
jgi:hypothetical protein